MPAIKFALSKQEQQKRSGVKVKRCEIHKFRRAAWNKNFMSCVEPACPTFQLTAQLIGKLVRCNDCGDPFVLDAYSAKTVSPKCVACRKNGGDPLLAGLEKILNREE